MIFKNIINLFKENRKFSIQFESKINSIENSNQSVGRHILIACQPKSGSTWLSNTLADITEYKKISFRPRTNDNALEQDIFLPQTLDFYKKNTISQQHVRYTDYNGELLNRIQVKIIVLTRNIFDIVISTLDHIENDQYNKSPMMYGSKDYFEKSLSEKTDMIIDLAIPWHIHFFASWYEASQQNKIEIKWMTYEELMANKVEVLNQILNFCDCDFPNSKVTQAINNKEIQGRFNKGRSGRGIEILSKNQIAKIQKYCSYYPKINFNKIGIT